MSKSKDFMSLGEAYKDVFKKVVINEEVPPGTSGEAPLTKGGPEEEGGFRKPLVDLDNMSDKDKKDNIYNIKGYSYGDGNDPVECQEPKPTGPTYGQVAYTGNVGPEEDEEEKGKRPDYPDVDEDGDTDESMEKALNDKKQGKKGSENEEDEEILGEHEKIARDGLNNFMSKTSVFDKLYNKVMVNENFGEDAEDVTELEALGIETETDVEVDDVPEEITVSIPGELAQSLCDILQTALAQQEVEVDVDVDVEEVTDTEFEEDEEAAMKDGGGYGIDAGSTLKHDVNMGKNNKVGNLKPVAGGPKMKDGGGYGVDAGSTHSKEVNMGKNNKVGTLKVGKNAFEQ